MVVTSFGGYEQISSSVGEWRTGDCIECLKKALSEDKKNFAAVNNPVVALLSQGKL